MQPLLNIINNYQLHILTNTKAFQELEGKLEQIDREIYGNEIDQTPLICTFHKDNRRLLVIRKDVTQNNILVSSYRIELDENTSHCYDNKHLDYFHLLEDNLYRLQQAYHNLNTSFDSVNDIAFDLNTTNGKAIVTFEKINDNIVATIKFDNVSIKYNIDNNKNKKKTKKNKQKKNETQKQIGNIKEVKPDVISEEETYTMLERITVFDIKVEKRSKEDSLSKTSNANQERRYSFHFDGLHDYTTYNVGNVMITYDQRNDQVVSVYPSVISEEAALQLLKDKGMIENVELTTGKIPKSR